MIQVFNHQEGWLGSHIDNGHHNNFIHRHSQAAIFSHVELRSYMTQYGRGPSGISQKFCKGWPAQTETGDAGAGWWLGPLGGGGPSFDNLIVLQGVVTGGRLQLVHSQRQGT